MISSPGLKLPLSNSATPPHAVFDRIDCLKSLNLDKKNLKVLIVTDGVVASLYLERLGRIIASNRDLETVHEIILEARENSKSFESLERILDALIGRDFSRDDLVISLGGGVVSDVTTLAVSLYKRGGVLNYIIVPTTLLSAVDASIGGKAAINYEIGGVYKKNIIGCFYNRADVLIDVDIIGQLATEIFRDGLAEVIKTSILKISPLNDILENARGIDELKPRLQDIIYNSIKIKTFYTTQDERDEGPRHALNLGHTIAHAIEECENFKISHGAAVAKGLANEAELSYMMGVCSLETKNKIIFLLNKFGFDLSFNYNLEKIISYIRDDKKLIYRSDACFVSMPVIKDVGNCPIVEIPLEKFRLLKAF